MIGPSRTRPKTVVAIHQPNFLPWLGFFDKLARADVFVLLDSVQFPRTSKGTWINRVKLLVGGRKQWATVPIVRSEGSVLPIAEVRIDEAQPWRKKLLRTIELTRSVGGTAYMPGGDAYRYQEDAMFAERGVELAPQEFVHPTYPQMVEPFVPGLSIADALLSCGFSGTRELLISGRSRAASPS